MWAKLDDKFHSHPKVIDAGNEAAGAFCRLLSYSCDHLTDGVLSEAVVRQFAGSDEVIARLCKTRLLDERGEGYAIHNFDLYNPSGVVVDERRRARSEAGRIGGQRSARVRSRSRSPETGSSPVGSPGLDNSDAAAFDFEELYARFPRRGQGNDGRSEGLAICRSEIRTAEDYEVLRSAIDNYTRDLKRRNAGATPTEIAKYTLKFSTFMAGWRDHVPVAGTIRSGVVTDDQSGAIDRPPWEAPYGATHDEAAKLAEGWTEDQKQQWRAENDRGAA